ncbi:LytS/YhcK type 5TM receptor domain-containing protein [Robertmurraya kyonggiensis]|uniref:Sensor histidine kinase n=1 Tax=Robertmurraya kyonggiensis TaxID=1037680 RepID=A0A4U1D511_9BACI|nr:LytS/YhcK type 5TM receptor domain-containing protein [Robertmurraya kyonggiensis]TKC16823.1 sensor histidine kinase [Robertmurraya kyonggiensis]
MLVLLITMVERLGILVMIAFIFTRFRFFRDMIYQEELNRKQQFTAIIFFGAFGIIGTYSGLTLSTDSLQFDLWTTDLHSNEAIANSRVIGVVIAGLLGGYKVGIGAGLIAGLHRFTLGGFTAVACGLAAIVSGIISGMFHKKNKHVKLRTAFLIGFLSESVQMLIILFLSRPFEKAMALVEIIGIPMILANGLGCALFLLIIKNVINEEEKAGALLAQKTLRIAEKTLAHLRNGLTLKTANEVCRILHKEFHTSAVAITSLTDILAHIGQGQDHHRADSPIQTQITLDAIQKGEITVANRELIQCRTKGCPLDVVVIAPLKQRNTTIGTLKLYFHSEKEINPVIMELISGISSLLSNQLEIAEVDKAYQLAKEAEIKVLQAQISPHFLFNSLNTILSLIRIEPMKARKLLVFLSKFLRQNLQLTTESATTLEQELKHVEAYLAIEEARFVNKLKIIYDVDEAALYQEIPPLTLQPIVENAIKHGMMNKEKDFILTIRIQIQEAMIHVHIEDNGCGMSQERAELISIAPIDSQKGNGLALYNVNRRLTITFGEISSLKIESSVNSGTAVSFAVPIGEVSLI